MYSIPPKTDSRNFGWYSELTSSSSQYQQLKLLKDVTSVPVEGFFFCDPDRNNNDDNYISIGIQRERISVLIKRSSMADLDMVKQHSL
ncbi:hypothetical protein GBAR_LOCUS14038 [Geodia barretti]|uniref:Uncharacterized protein n=1 Tax=Geodia barretti TaxID=519541 RepID=A0AA35S717_GEOBA|nr:hypothetical protein GBAR_LOCUS14038 [Geodia barretti]